VQGKKYFEKKLSDQEKIHKSQKRGRFKKVGKMPIFISTSSSYPGSEQQRNYDKKTCVQVRQMDLQMKKNA
jgi:hypothetical protein